MTTQCTPSHTGYQGRHKHRCPQHLWHPGCHTSPGICRQLHVLQHHRCRMLQARHCSRYRSNLHPDFTQQQDPLSWDKLLNMMVVPVNCILGLIINTRLLTVGVFPEFLSEVIHILQTMWGHHQHTFVASKAKILTGKLNHIGFGALWLKFLLGHIYSSLAHALQWNQAHLIRTSHTFRCALKATRTAPTTPDGNKQHAFHTGNTAQLTHHSKCQHFIGRNTE